MACRLLLCETVDQARVVAAMLMVVTILWSATRSKHLSCEQFQKENQGRVGDMARYLGTKLPYQLSFSEMEVGDESELTGCDAVKLYALIRHGTRYPTAKHISSWSNFIDSRVPQSHNDNMTPSLKNLKVWTNPFLGSTNVAAQLTDHGVKEQYCLAKRLKTRFNSLLQQPYSSDVYSFRSTQSSRTSMSAQAFAAGLYEGQGVLNGYQPVYIETVDTERDYLLRFTELPCPVYDTQVLSNNTLIEDLQRFLYSHAMQTALKQVQQQIDPDIQYWNVSVEDMLTMYRICVHELGLLGSSIWCELFSFNTLETLLYQLDMKSYWKKGGGFPVTWQRSVRLVKSIIDFFTTFSNPSVALRFAHSETVLALLTFFSVLPDSPKLLPDNYEELLHSRHYVLSNISPYSSNVVFVMYSCALRRAEYDQQLDDQLYVRLLVNEVPLPLCNCGGSMYMCPLKELVAIATNRSANFTSFTKLCNKNV